MPTPVDDDQRQRFLQEIVPAAAAICPQFGLDPRDCIVQAALGSSCGRYVLGFNWWNLPGRGDGGFFTSIVPVRTGQQAGGGWQAQEQQVAKFRSPMTAVTAWCKIQRG